MPLSFTATGSTIWPAWVQNSIACTTSTIHVPSVIVGNQQVWYSWNSNTTSSTAVVYPATIVYSNWATQQALVQETREQKEAGESRRRWNWFWQELVAVFQRAEKDRAKVKAKKLLIEHLSTAQRDEYEKTGSFVVTVEGTRYRIDTGRSGNVKEYDQAGKLIYSYCIHPREDVPDEDTMLAQKLLLETDTPAFKRIANRSAFY